MPIIFLSSTDDSELKVAALESGADDYMTKPFSITELLARIKAITRRPAAIKTRSYIKVGDMMIDTDKQICERAGKKINLTRKEFSLLEYMMRHPDMILSRANIMEKVWTADSDPFSNTVEAHIRNIRKKLNTNNEPNIIINVPGRGYMIETK